MIQSLRSRLHPARRARLLPIALLLGLSALAGCASAPAPTEQDRRAAAQIIDTEQRFAAAVAQLGMRDGFLQFVAADAMLIRKSAVPAVATLQAEPADRYWLDWYPDRIVTAGVGDIAVSTGPFESRAERNDRRSIIGRYFSIWRRDELNTWKLAFDAGVRFDKRECAPCLAPLAQRSRKDWALPDPGPDADGARQAELRFEQAQHAGDRSALTKAAHPKILVMREGQDAFEGAAAVAAIEALAHVDATSRSAVVISQSDDLAYVWGEMQSALGKHGNWARVWIRNPEGWRVLLDWNDLPQAR